jgi:hypothetical protein
VKEQLRNYGKAASSPAQRSGSHARQMRKPPERFGEGPFESMFSEWHADC